MEFYCVFMGVLLGFMEFCRVLWGFNGDFVGFLLSFKGFCGVLLCFMGF